MKCENCKATEADVNNYGMDLCNTCEKKISYQLDGIRDVQRINTSRYGNKEGTIDRYKYTYGDRPKKWGQA